MAATKKQQLRKAVTQFEEAVEQMQELTGISQMDILRVALSTGGWKLEEWLERRSLKNLREAVQDADRV